MERWALKVARGTFCMHVDALHQRVNLFWDGAWKVGGKGGSAAATATATTTTLVLLLLLLRLLLMHKSSWPGSPHSAKARRAWP